MSYDILIDFESRSEIDIDAGQWRYWADPTTEILCCGFATKHAGEWSPVGMVVFEPGEHGFDAVKAKAREDGFAGDFFEITDLLDLLHGATRVVAHNFGFERAAVICKLPMLTVERCKWSCTAARSRRLGLPGSLENVLKVLGLGEKDMEGHSVMLQCSKPRPAWKKTGKGRKWFDDANRLGRNVAYCARDIIGEIAVDDFLPELDPIEHRRWWHIQDRNDVGLRIDKTYLNNAIKIVEQHNADVTARIAHITGDQVTNLNAVDTVVAYLRRQGCHMEGLAKDEVTRVLERKDLLTPIAAAVLEARQEVTKASTKKLYSIRERLMGDGTIKDSAIYFGAHTGRDTGSGAQPLNMPRPDDVVALDARVAIREYDLEKLAKCVDPKAAKRQAGTVSGVTTYRGPKFYVGPSEAVAESLRTAFIPSPGYRFVAGDYSKQELVMTFWVAGQHDVLEKLKDPKYDPYVNLAVKIYGRPIDKHEDPNERNLGKQGVLGGGFGLSKAATFQATAAKYGMGLTEEIAGKTIAAYAEEFPMVPKAWKGLYSAAVQAMQNPMKWYDFRGVAYRYDGHWLAVVLHNGSWRYYPKPKLEEGRFGKPSISYSSTYQGKVVRKYLHGGLCLENVVQSEGREWTEEDAEAIRQETGYWVALNVYDEICCEVPIDDLDAEKRIKEIMSRPKRWAPGLEIGVDVWSGDCYRKG